MVIQIKSHKVRPIGQFEVGDVVTLRRPTADEELAAQPGWHPWLDRLVGQRLTVRAVAKAEGFDLVLVNQTRLPIRGSWLL